MDIAVMSDAECRTQFVKLVRSLHNHAMMVDSDGTWRWWCENLDGYSGFGSVPQAPHPRS